MDLYRSSHWSQKWSHSICLCNKHVEWQRSCFKDNYKKGCNQYVLADRCMLLYVLFSNFCTSPTHVNPELIQYIHHVGIHTAGWTFCINKSHGTFVLASHVTSRDEEAGDFGCCMLKDSLSLSIFPHDLLIIDFQLARPHPSSLLCSSPLLSSPLTLIFIFLAHFLPTQNHSQQLHAPLQMHLWAHTHFFSSFFSYSLLPPPFLTDLSPY